MILRFQQKLIVPTAARPLIERAKLTEQLEAAITSRRVVVLAAPAGWGKTTALAQWAAKSTLPIAWYTLDQIDRDPRLFLDYLLHALDRLVPDASQVSTQLTAAPPQGLPDLYQAAGLAIAGAPAPFALILDDFHLIEDDPLPALPGASLIFELLGTIIQYAPNCHLIFASRTLPARQGLARLSVQQQATLFDYAALQFLPADVQQLARVATRLELPADSAVELTRHFGGWAAGIVLSLDQAVQPGGDVWAHHPVDANQIHDYFAEQVITPLDPQIQQFLADTSVLEELSPQRCNILRDKRDSAQILDEVRRRGLFAAHRGEWLVYHSLLRDFLRARLAKDPAREQLMLRRAGDLYYAEDDLERAITCYLAAGAEQQAIVALRTAAPRLLQHSRQTTLLTCFERLGQKQGLPADLLLMQARVYRDLAVWERAKLSIQLAEALGDAETRWEATLLHAELLNLQSEYPHAKALLDTLKVAELPSRLQFAYYRTLGRVQVLAGEIRAAITTLEQAHTLALTTAEAASDPGTLATLYDLLGWAYALQRDWPATLRHLQRADACWQASGNKGRRTMTLNNLGTVAMEQGRYTEARAALETGLALAQETGRRREEASLRRSMADLDLYEGQFAQALEQFREAYTLAARLDLSNHVAIAAVGALWVAALAGTSPEAETWQPIVAEHAVSDLPEVRGRKALALSLLLLRQPRPDGALLAKHLAEAVAVEDAMLSADRAYLALLRAAQTFERTGWAEAAAAWEEFEQRAAGLSEALLIHFVPPHRRLFDVAAQASSLAQRLLSARQDNRLRRWQITALGTFVCLVDGVACDLSPLHRALLVCLLDAGQKGLAVEQLWESIWGESDISMAAIHQALYRLRTQTGLAAAARDGICAIQSSWDMIEYDVRALEKILREPISTQSIQQAQTLYQGDFLLSVPPSAGLWADTRRTYLRQRYLDMLEVYARSIEDVMPSQALQYYQQILQIDGCREQTALLLMRVAARSGNYSLITEIFEQLKGSLRALGTTPEPATVAFIEATLR